MQPVSQEVPIPSGGTIRGEVDPEDPSQVHITIFGYPTEDQLDRARAQLLRGLRSALEIEGVALDLGQIHIIVNTKR